MRASVGPSLLRALRSLGSTSCAEVSSQKVCLLTSRSRQTLAHRRLHTGWDVNGIRICFSRCAHLCVHTAVYQEQWTRSMCVITHTSAVLAGRCLWCSSKVCIHNSSSSSSGQLCCSCSLLAGRRCRYCCRHSRCDPLLLHRISVKQPETVSLFLS